MYAHTHLCRHTHTHTHTHTHITKENFAYLSRRKENDRFLIAASLIGRFWSLVGLFCSLVGLFVGLFWLYRIPHSCADHAGVCCGPEHQVGRKSPPPQHGNSGNRVQGANPWAQRAGRGRGAQGGGGGNGWCTARGARFSTGTWGSKGLVWTQVSFVWPGRGGVGQEVAVRGPQVAGRGVKEVKSRICGWSTSKARKKKVSVFTICMYYMFPIYPYTHILTFESTPKVYRPFTDTHMISVHLRRWGRGGSPGGASAGWCGWAGGCLLRRCSGFWWSVLHLRLARPFCRCVCVCVCVLLYTHTHTHTHTRLFLYMYTHTHTHKQTGQGVYVYIYVYIYI